jgi:hypothetical protein
MGGTYNPKLLFDLDALANEQTVAQLVASTAVSRGVDSTWRAGPYRYREVSSGGELVTAGGVRLNPLPLLPGIWHAGAWGGDPTNYSSTLQSIQDYVISQGAGTIQLSPGVHVLTSAVATSGYSDSGDGTQTTGLHLRGVNGLTTLRGNGSSADFIRWKNMLDCSIADLVFDYRGTVNQSFTNPVTISKELRVAIERCVYLDSAPTTANYTIGTGNGSTTSFLFENDAFKDRHLMPGTVTIAAPGGQTLTDAGHTDGRLTGDGSGSIVYGDNNGNWAVSVTFDSPPSSGDIVMTVGETDQRQSIVLLNCDNVVVRDNNLSNGGRIKVGRPGRFCLIENNWLYGVNDNGITVVNIEDVGDTSDITIRGNTILHPATVGIFAGSDGDDQSLSGQQDVRLRIVGNTVLAPRTCLRYTLTGQSNGPTLIHGNTFQIQSLVHNGTRVYQPDSDTSACVDLADDATNITLSENTIESSDLCAVSIPPCSNVKILGNTIGTVGEGKRALRFAGGLASGVRVQGNTFYCGMLVTGASGASWQDCVFSDNTIYSRNDQAADGMFQFSTSVLDVDIRNNTLRMLSGTADQPFVRTTAAGTRIRAFGNDWGPSRITGFTVSGDGTYHADSVLTPNYGIQPE